MAIKFAGGLDRDATGKLVLAAVRGEQGKGGKEGRTEGRKGLR